MSNLYIIAAITTFKQKIKYSLTIIILLCKFSVYYIEASYISYFKTKFLILKNFLLYLNFICALLTFSLFVI